MQEAPALPPSPATAFTVRPWHSLTLRFTLSVLAVLLLGLWALAWYAATVLRQDIQELLGQQQSATVAMVAAQVEDALALRQRALLAVASATTLATAEGEAAVLARLEGLPLLQQLFNGGVAVFTAQGRKLAAHPASLTEPLVAGQAARGAVAQVLRTGLPVIGSADDDAQRHPPAFSQVVPVRDAQGRVVAVLAGVTQLTPQSFLDQITGNAYGRNGGYMLVSRSARQIITATDRRRVLEALPAAGASALVDRFIAGYEGHAVGRNALGVEVLASASSVGRNAGWYVAAALPTQEAFAPVHQLLARVAGATLALTALAGVLTWWLVRRQLSPMLTAARTLSAYSTGHGPAPALAVTRHDEVGQLIAGFNRLVLALGAREQALRIAAIAFESQEGMLVLDAQRRILRVNRAFTRITGYAAHEVQGQVSGMARSVRHPDDFWDALWLEVAKTGAWQGEVWNRRKNGEEYLSRTCITAVRNEADQITHYVGNFTDVTTGRMREEERSRREAEQRQALVREVHHRIKNNLQGVIGILRAFGHTHPELKAPINHVVGQVQSIAVIHGLQGRATLDQVRACELARAVAEGVAGLWNADIRFELPEPWQPCVLARGEAVPVALVLNELVLNAVKHGTPGAPVRVALQAAHAQGTPCIRILIENRGQWRAVPGARQIGLELVHTLMPADGASLSRSETADVVQTWLELGPPVISLEPKEA